jgi:Tol biopolymer transport system component
MTCLSRFARFLLLLLPLAVLVALPANAQYFGRNKVNYDQFDFRVLETEHFEIHYYPEAETAVRDAARMAERWYERHTQTFLHRFTEKKPIILYANDADFQQTNVIEGTIGEGTGGFTESVRERVVMPLTGVYGSTDHVLGHELVHSFQYDLAFNQGSGRNVNLRQIPLWLVEGMAEYLTIGRHDPHTAMWMRDAALRDDLPTIQDLNNPRAYFPYRYGQAVLAYIAGTYGDQAVPNLFKMAGRVGVDSAFVFLYGQSTDSLSAEWARAVQDAYLPLVENRTPADSAGRRVLANDIDGGRLNVAPVLSPDGRYVAFLSERDLFDITLYVADARTGEVLTSLGSIATEPDLDAIRFISSAGSWDPAGERLAFVSFAEGDNEISIWNVEENEITQSFRVRGVTALKNPAWSPDGQSIAFTGMDGGISDLYVLDLETRAVRQLTNDRHADLQPTWSPDGQTLAFTTDRRSTDLSVLRTSQRMQIGLIDAESGALEVIEPFPGAHHHNPQFAPDGRSLYFISTHDGFKDIYRTVIAEETGNAGALYQVTRLQTGVSGITALSPAMSIARQSGDMMFSVYDGGEYVGVARSRNAIEGTPLPPSLVGDARPDRLPGAASADTSDSDSSDSDSAAPEPDALRTAEDGPPRAGVLPPYTAAAEGLVDTYLSDASSGLPSAGTFTEHEASSRLSLEGIFPPTVGVSVGGPFGGGVGGGVGLRFGDMLGNQRLDVVAQANGTFRDIGGGVAYLNRARRLNIGASASHIPIIFDQDLVRGPTGRLNIITERLFISQISLNGAYPLSTTRRFEAGLGGVRYGFGTNVNGPDDRRIEDEIDRIPTLNRDTEYFGRSSLAFVIDTADFGFTSPVRGGRYRLQVAPQLGTESFVNVLADLRRYLYARPFTFAMQAVHVGNYGASIDDIFGDEYLGSAFSPTFVRGYSFRSFDEFSDCTTSDCEADFDRLIGTRAAKISGEIRLPILGVRPLSLVSFPVLPTELTLFGDVGLAWAAGDDVDFDFRRDASSARRTPVASAGVSFRVNLFGSIILEPYWAYAFQREQPSFFGLLLQPGW